MGNTSDQSRDQTAKPVESVEAGNGEGDNKAEDSVAGGISDAQWKSMMDVLMAIYEFREEE